MRLSLLRLPPLVALIGVAALLMLVPAAKAALDGQAPVGRAFFYWSLLLLILASLVAIALSGRRGKAAAQGPFSLLALVYLVLPAVMALPLAEVQGQMRLFDAWFEMVSAFTTTGASLIDLPRRAPEAVHLWRGMAGWLGGLFILAVASALLAPLRLGGYEMLDRGTARVGGFAPGAEARLWGHLTALLPIYAGLTAALWLILVVQGLPGFDAVMLSMGTLSTSGILPRESMGAVGLPAEIALFCFLALALSRRTLEPRGLLRAAPRDPELMTGLALVALVSLFVLGRHWAGAFVNAGTGDLPAMGRAAWGAAFTGMSFLTTTGFVSEDWIVSRAWSGLTPPGLVLMGLGLLGGGVATTAGGIKLMRMLALARLGQVEAVRMIYPSMVVGGSDSDRFLATTGARAAWLFAMVFALTSVVVVGALLMTGMPLENAMIFAVGALTNTGQLAQVAGPSALYWFLLDDPARMILAIAMILGRLEMIVLLAAVLHQTRDS